MPIWSKSGGLPRTAWTRPVSNCWLRGCNYLCLCLTNHLSLYYLLLWEVFQFSAFLRVDLITTIFPFKCRDICINSNLIARLTCTHVHCSEFQTCVCSWSNKLRMYYIGQGFFSSKLALLPINLGSNHRKFHNCCSFMAFIFGSSVFAYFIN